MGIVEQISIKLETFFIRFFCRPFDVDWGVTKANMLVATQWSPKRAPHLQEALFGISSNRQFAMVRLELWET